MTRSPRSKKRPRRVLQNDRSIGSPPYFPCTRNSSGSDARHAVVGNRGRGKLLLQPQPAPPLGDLEASPSRVPQRDRENVAAKGSYLGRLDRKARRGPIRHPGRERRLVLGAPHKFALPGRQRPQTRERSDEPLPRKPATRRLPAVTASDRPIELHGRAAGRDLPRATRASPAAIRHPLLVDTGGHATGANSSGSTAKFA